MCYFCGLLPSITYIEHRYRSNHVRTVALILLSITSGVLPLDLRFTIYLRFGYQLSLSLMLAVFYFFLSISYFHFYFQSSLFKSVD